MLMVDRATPPTDAELAMFAANGVAAVGAYCGGANNGGRAWKPADFDRLRAAGLKVLPIYVGENACDGCKKPLELTATRGALDAVDAVASARRFGCHDGPLCLDVEYDTYMGNVAGALAYMAAWADGVHGAGYLPVQYAITRTAIDYVPPIPTGLWIANWDNVGDLTKFPNAARFTGIGWQYTSSWHGWDASNVDGGWWDAPSDPPLPESRFFPETGQWLSHGFLRFWEQFGGLPIFGYPISEEYQRADGVTVQWTERARLEHRPGLGLPWDVQLGRLGAEANQCDAVTYAASFAPTTNTTR